MSVCRLAALRRHLRLGVFPAGRARIGFAADAEEQVAG